MSTPQTNLTKEEYLAILAEISTEIGPDQGRANALSVHQKRQVVQYQMANEFPVLQACITADLKPILSKSGYKGGYTNRNRSARYYIKPGNALHSRMMIHDNPIRKVSARITDKQAGPAMKRIGRQITEIVAASGKSQTGFAARTGIPQSTLSDLKRGTENFTVNRLEGFFNKMGYRVTGFTLEKIDRSDDH